MHELSAVADRLNDPDVPLEEAIALYKQGMQAADRAQTLLDGYRQEVEIISKPFANEGGSEDD